VRVWLFPTHHNICALGRADGQPLGKSWETCEELVAMLYQKEQALHEAHLADKAAKAKAQEDSE
jgi:hypothetical protein